MGWLGSWCCLGKDSGNGPGGDWVNGVSGRSRE